MEIKEKHNQNQCLKILHLSAVNSWGGGENHIENLCFELEKTGDAENTILCVRNKPFHLKLKGSKIPFLTAPLQIKMDPRYIYKIISLCKKGNFDLIHIHDSTALALAVSADQFFKLPPFIFSKKTSFPIRPRRRTLFKYNYPKIKRILCVSEATREISTKTLDRHDRLEVIYHGTRLDNKAKKCPFRIRSKFNFPEGAVIVGNIGNHIEAKNLETFIRTAHYLVNQKQKKNIFFVQMGYFGERTEALQKLAKELNLEERVLFLGFIPEASAFIPQFNITLITSESEGIPQVIYESFYHNVPVVSTKAGGIPEVIEDKVNGLLNDVYDHTGLGENLLFLIDNPQVIPNFAKISREKLFRSFTSEIMAQKTLTEYKKVING